METTSANVMTTPGGFEDAPLAKRSAHRGMLPSTWVGRTVKLRYEDAGGLAVDSSGTLLDWCPVGPVFSLAGERAIVAWERICLLTLQND